MPHIAQEVEHSTGSVANTTLNASGPKPTEKEFPFRLFWKHFSIGLWKWNSEVDRKF